MMIMPMMPVNGPSGFWTTPAVVSLVAERPGTVYYRLGAGPGSWTPCVGPIAIPEGKQVLSALLVSPGGVPGEVVTTTIRSDFTVPPVVGTTLAGVGTYAGASNVSGSVVVKAEVRAQVGTTVRRLGGQDRYDVSTLLSDTSFTSANTVIIASGEKFPDALTAAGLAGCLKAPVLLVAHNKVPAQIAREIKALKAKNVIVCGGPATVYPSVITSLKKRGLKVERISGANRYEVAARVAQRIAKITGGKGRVYIARGDIYPDALSFAPLAYAQRVPILLTQPKSLAKETRDELKRGGYTSVRIAGGTASVSSSVEKLVKARVRDTVRWGGNGRYETSVVIATNAVAQGSNTWAYVGVAKGTVFSDALCGGVAAGSRGGVILLTAPEPLTPVVANALTAHAGEVRDLDVYGGPASVKPRTYEQLLSIFR